MTTVSRSLRTEVRLIITDVRLIRTEARSLRTEVQHVTSQLCFTPSMATVYARPRQSSARAKRSLFFLL